MRDSIFSSPIIYKTFQKIVSRKNIDGFFEHKPESRVLDIGCGPGNQAWRFLDSDYTGIDTSAEYIEEAKAKYNDSNIKFHCIDANKYLEEKINNGTIQQESYDFIFMFGVLHHLNDDDAGSCLKSASRLLKLDGVFRSYDGVYLDKQSRLVRKILDNDRGKFVRTPIQYDVLFNGRFSSVTYQIRTDMLRIPYAHIIYSAQNMK